MRGAPNSITIMADESVEAKTDAMGIACRRLALG